ncbi:MAG: arylesterase [Azospira oryzae]|nr:MAG: arylesterase [Azospira oryzae]PZP77165.1 MAG: arylesterase [Azospira oryzae]
MRPLALALFLLALAGCGGPRPQLAPLAPSDVVLAFGDSLTFGTGAPEDQSYPAVLGRLIGREVVRSGVPGETTGQALARLPGVLEEVRPRLVLLCLGGNDMLRKVNEQEIAENLRAMVRMIRDRGADVVLVAVPRPALLADPPAFYRAIAEEFRLPLEDQVVKEVLYSTGLKADPIHPNAEGYRRIAEALAELLRRSGAL